MSSECIPRRTGAGEVSGMVLKTHRRWLLGAALAAFAGSGVAVAQQAGVVPVATSAVASSLQVRTVSGSLLAFQVTTGSTAGYVLIYSGAAPPADGAVTPRKCYAVAANTTLGVSFGVVPIFLSGGSVIVFSSTGCFTQTSSATAYISAEAAGS